MFIANITTINKEIIQTNTGFSLLLVTSRMKYIFYCNFLKTLYYFQYFSNGNRKCEKTRLVKELSSNEDYTVYTLFLNKNIYLFFSWWRWIYEAKDGLLSHSWLRLHRLKLKLSRRHFIGVRLNLQKLKRHTSLKLTKMYLWNQ